MCGRYVTPEEAAIERFWQLSRGQLRNPLAPRFNVAPASPVPIVFIENGAPVVDRARWGLVPVWWKQPKLPPFTFNARIEEAASKPMWRTPLKHSRCLVPALGWYEWRTARLVDPVTGEMKAARQPHFLHLPDRGLIHFAGLMSRREPRDDAVLPLSCTIMTRAATGRAAEVYERMPVILDEEALRDWLDPTQKDTDLALAVAEGRTVTDVTHYPVSSRVNQAKNEGAELLEPLEKRPSS